MLPTYGKDRCRIAGERIVLFSAIPKGWTPRTPATGTHAEYPGTTVQWNGQMFEVVEAHSTGAGVRYVLLPWREDHVIRTLEQYDADSERERLLDFEKAQRQRRASTASRLSGMFLGFLPARVQNRMQRELGVDPARMTILSCIPPLVILAICVLDAVDATLKRRAPVVPVPLTFLAVFLVMEAALRFFIAMSQNRGAGSIVGLVGYAAYRAVSRTKAQQDVKPDEAELRTTSVLAPPDDVVRREMVETLAPFLTLLSRADQERLARNHAYDPRRHASGVAVAILAFALLGVVTMYDDTANGTAARISFLLAVALTAEQSVRLVILRSRPVGSMLRMFVRPLVRHLLDPVQDVAGG